MKTIQTRRFTVQTDPVAKARPRVTRAGITYTPKSTLEFEKKVKEAYKKRYLLDKPIAGAMRVKVVCYFKIPKSYTKKKQAQIMNDELLYTKKPDIDNLAKGVLDALNGTAYIDDSSIIGLMTLKGYAKNGNPRVEVTIEEIQADDTEKDSQN